MLLYEPPFEFAIQLGAVVAIWAAVIYAICRVQCLSGNLRKDLRLILCRVSGVASIVCIGNSVRIPDWRLLLEAWRQGRFRALPGHSALRWWFVLESPWAMVAPAFANLAFRLADLKWAKALAGLLCLASVGILIMTVHGLLSL